MIPDRLRRSLGLLIAPGAALVDLLYPPACSICDELLDSPVSVVCPTCRFGFDTIPAPVCEHCGQPSPAGSICTDCRHHPQSLRPIRSAFAFGGPLKQAVLALKLSGLRELAGYLADRLAEADLPGWDWSAVDLLVPVPLHRRRLLDRGFNQATLLARRLSASLHIRCEIHALRRGRPTPSQSRMPGRPERMANVHGAFTAARPRTVAGLAVCLVDDVVTTGATLSACAGPLMDAGARSVCAVTVARTLSL